MCDHGRANIGSAWEQMEDTRREPSLLEDACKCDTSTDGSAWIGFEQDGVAEREGRRDGPDGEDQRALNGAMTPITPAGKRRAKLKRGASVRTSCP